MLGPVKVMALLMVRAFRSKVALPLVVPTIATVPVPKGPDAGETTLLTVSIFKIPLLIVVPPL